jgi:polyferredoxin
MAFYSTFAAVTLVLHVSYVAFVVFGLLLVWAGIACRWKWIRNRWFRTIHLVMITIVVLEAWAGIVCPLTTLENWFRTKSGQNLYEGDFISIWLHDLLFIDLPPWAFTVAYTLFGLAVLGTLWLAPPQFRQVAPASRSKQ